MKARKLITPYHIHGLAVVLGKRVGYATMRTYHSAVAIFELRGGAICRVGTAHHIMRYRRWAVPTLQINSLGATGPLGVAVSPLILESG